MYIGTVNYIGIIAKWIAGRTPFNLNTKIKRVGEVPEFDQAAKRPAQPSFFASPWRNRNHRMRKIIWDLMI